MFCAGTLAGLVISWLLLLGLDVSIPLDAFRQPIETAVSRALGRQVKIDGELVLRPTMNPTIVAHELRIVSVPGRGELLRAGRVAVPLSLLALLRGELPSERLLIEDAILDLDARRLSSGAVPPPAQPEWRELVLQPLTVNYRADDGEHGRPVRFDRVSVHSRPGQALALMLEGQLQRQPYRIELKGGRLEDLLTASGSWPLQGRASYADTTLLLDGRLEISRRQLVMTSEVSIDWPAAYGSLAARFTKAPLLGRLSMSIEDGRPRVQGELRAPALDAMLRFDGAAEPVAGRSEQRDPSGTSPAPRSGAVPVSVSVADERFNGRLDLLERAGEVVPELALSAVDINVGSLLARLTGRDNIRGRIRRLHLQTGVRAHGKTGVLNRVALALRLAGAELSYGNADGARPVDLSVDELELSLPEGEAMRLRARGTLLDESFSVEGTAADLEALLLDEAWPVTLSAKGSGAVLDINGSVAVSDADRATRLQLGLYGERLGDLSAWSGVSPCAAAAYLLQGQLVLAGDIGRLQFLRFQTDRSRLSGELDWSGYDQGDRLLALLRFEALNPADIAVLIPLFKRGSDDGAASVVAIDMPVLARPIDLLNADIDLAIEHIPLSPVDITEVSLLAGIRQGRLQRSPFHAHVGGASFQGYLDPEDAETAVVFENEDNEDGSGGRMNKLFSDAVRWVGSTAIVPLRWLLEKKLAAGDSADCQR
jgi:hypothetical protein